MDNTTIFTKTAKGLGETLGKTRALTRDARKILKEIDGRSAVTDLLDRLDLPEARLHIALAKLVADDYIREFASAAAGASMGDTGFGNTMPARIDDPLTKLTMGDFLRAMEQAPAQSDDLGAQSLGLPANPTLDPVLQKAQADQAVRAEQARREAALLAQQIAEQQIAKQQADQARARQLAAEQANQAAAEQARQAAAAQAEKAAEEQARLAAAQAKKEAQEQARLAAEEQARKEAEARARQAAEEQAKRAAEEQARTAALEQARLEAQAQARKEAAEQARIEAEAKAQQAVEERARKDAEEQARLQAEAEAKAKQAAEEQVRKAAEERARLEAEVKARQAAEEQARQAAEEQARIEAQAKAQQAAEDQARLDAENRARKAAEEQARLAAEEQARQAAQEQAASQAQERAKQEAEACARAEAEAQARRLAQEQAEREAKELVRHRAWEAARRAAEELAQREAQARAKQEAEEQARIEAEQALREQAQQAARQLAEEQARQLANEQARQLAEQQARERAAQQAREQAEEQQRRAAQLQAKKAEQEQARLLAEQQARERSEQKARQQAEDRARRDAAKLAKQQAKEQARLAARQQADIAAAEKARRAAAAAAEKQAQQQAKQAAKEQAAKLAQEKAQEAARRKAEEVARVQAQKQAAHEATQRAAPQAREQPQATQSAAPASTAALGPPRNWFKLAKPAALGLTVVAVAALAAVHVVPFDSRIPQLEQAAFAQWRQPVHIGALRLALFPKPHWRLQQVTVGADGQIAAAQVDAAAALGDLLGQRMRFESVRLHAPVLTADGLRWLLFGRPGASGLQVAHLEATHARLAGQDLALPTFHAKAEIGADGRWKNIALQAEDQSLQIDLQPKNDGVQVALSADSFMPPFAGAPTLTQFHATGTATGDALALSEFNGITFDGVVRGSARLTWTNGWGLTGAVQAKQVDAARIVPQLLQSGRLDGSAKYAFEAPSAAALLGSPRATGEFLVNNGVLLGIDFSSLLRGAPSGGQSSFNRASGQFAYQNGTMRLDRIELGAGLVSGSGAASVASDRQLSGRFAIDLKSPGRHTRGGFTLAGTLAAPQFQR